MILECRNEIQVTAVVTSYRNKSNVVEKFDMYFPDFDITVHSTEFLSVFAKAEMVIRAVYESSVSRGVTPTSKVSYDAAQVLCNKPNMFIINLRVTFPGGNQYEEITTA